LQRLMPLKKRWGGDFCHISFQLACLFSLHRRHLGKWKWLLSNLIWWIFEIYLLCQVLFHNYSKSTHSLASAILLLLWQMRFSQFPLLWPRRFHWEESVPHLHCSMSGLHCFSKSLSQSSANGPWSPLYLWYPAAWTW
jgi:hypothetical protein